MLSTTRATVTSAGVWSFNLWVLSLQCTRPCTLFLSSSGLICSPFAAVLSALSSTHQYPLFFALRWQDGEKSGRGAYKWAADGRVYRGEWRHNKANGVGLLTRPSKPLQSSSSSPRSPKLSSTEVPFLFTLAIVRPYANTSASKPLSLLFLPFQMWLHLNL